MHKIVYAISLDVVPSQNRQNQTLASENVSARVCNQIKHLILCSEMMSGPKLNHQQRSERLGVSRTPVREALTRFVQEGYVSFLSIGVFTCKEIRMQEADELYERVEAPSAFALETLKQRRAIRDLRPLDQIH